MIILGTLVFRIAGAIISIWISVLCITNFIFNFTCTEYNKLLPEYDYIVVGAGSAGSIVARRLSETNSSVLLIEAGESCSSWILDVPILSPLLQLSQLDWQFRTVTQKHACFSLEGNSSRWPRGKVVGGTSHINYLMYVRGHRKDYDKWFEAGNAGWQFFDDLLPYFRRSEKQIGKYNYDAYHSTAGPTFVNDNHHTTPLADAFVKAGVELGYHARDVNSAHQTGFMESQVHLHKGQRWNVDYGYLNNHKYNKISILCGALVSRVSLAEYSTHLAPIRFDFRSLYFQILFHSKFEAKGVEVVYSDKKFNIRAHRAVVLSAGTIGSPVVLMRSGIGPSAHLNELKIPVVKDLHVGKNLQDHITTGVDLILLNQSLSLGLSDVMSVSSFIKYLYEGKGPLSATGCEAFGVIHSDLVDEIKDPPDLQIMALPMGLSSDYGTHMITAMGVKQEVWNEYFSPLRGRYVASLMPVLLHPKSHGEVKLRSQNIEDAPTINPNYLTHENDIKTLYEGINIVKKLISTQSMQELGAQLYSKNIRGCEDQIFDSADYWLCYIKHLTLTSYHPIGTCKMGPISDNSAVVDSNLRVYGTNKLFVIDASIMPTLPSGNINAAVMMIAEKGADMVKEFWHNTVEKNDLRNFFSPPICEHHK